MFETAYEQLLDEENSQHQNDENTPTKNTRSVFHSSLTLLDLTFRCLTVLALSVLIYKALSPSQTQCTASPSQASEIQMVYGVNKDYFSLENSSDFLWDDDLDPFQTTIFEEWNEEHGVWQEGVIGMYVAFLDLLWYRNLLTHMQVSSAPLSQHNSQSFAEGSEWRAHRWGWPSKSSLATLLLVPEAGNYLCSRRYHRTWHR